jgi:hypothetical protein
MTPNRREILEKVASGDLTPEEAETLLNEDAPPGSEGSEAPARPTPTIRRVRISAGFGAISVVGDADVAEAEIEGIHQASVDGDTLVIAGDFEGVTPGVFAVNLGGRRGRRIRVHTGHHGRGRSAGALRVRINPSLELDAKLDAGPLSISGIAAPIRARSAAGPITIEDVVEPIDVAVNAGAIRINGRFDHGDSRVRSDAGAIRIELEAGSDVEVSANAALGKVVVPGMTEGGKGFGSTRSATVGSGAATLRVETAMGSIQVLER